MQDHNGQVIWFSNKVKIPKAPSQLGSLQTKIPISHLLTLFKGKAHLANFLLVRFQQGTGTVQLSKGLLTALILAAHLVDVVHGSELPDGEDGLHVGGPARGFHRHDLAASSRE